MNRFVITGALGAACLMLMACGDREADTANAANDAAAGAEAAGGNASGSTASAAAAFPAGTRIVEESGVTFRIDPDGTRVQLGPNESRIVVEDGVRFRVDPDGSRVRIDDQGLAVDVDLPDVDVGVNDKGNLDVDVTPDTGRNENR